MNPEYRVFYTLLAKPGASFRHAKLTVHLNHILSERKKMKKILKVCMVTLALVLLASPLQADKGKALHEDKCTRCHNSDIFTREDRSVHDIEVLKTRVKVCSIAAEAKWSDEEISIVVDYLNKNYYKF